MGKPKTILLAEPRGFCAGVMRALDLVDAALGKYGRPIFVKHEIVHNIHVITELERKGVVFIDQISDMTKGRPLIFSAHGVPLDFERKAGEAGIDFIDATCPLVKKIHRKAERLSSESYKIIIVGHHSHPEVIGIKGHVQGLSHIIEGIDDIKDIPFGKHDKTACIFQTTLNTDETSQIMDQLRIQLPGIVGDPSDDICYATRDRQNAVASIAEKSDAVLIIGSSSSSNSRRLAELAKKICPDSFLIEDETQIPENILSHAIVTGISAGASAPESLVKRVIASLREKGWTHIQE